MDGKSEKQQEILLNQDFISLKKLHDLLTHEQQLMTSQTLDSIAPLIQAKTQVLNEIENRYSLIQKNNHFSIKNFWEQSLKNAITHQWSIRHKIPHLIKLLDAVDHLNRVNSRVAQRLQNRFSELLSIMRGGQNAPALYTAQGKPITSHAKRSIIPSHGYSKV